MPILSIRSPSSVCPTSSCSCPQETSKMSILTRSLSSISPTLLRLLCPMTLLRSRAQCLSYTCKPSPATQDTSDTEGGQGPSVTSGHPRGAFGREGQECSPRRPLTDDRYRCFLSGVVVCPSTRFSENQITSMSHSRSRTI